MHKSWRTCNIFFTKKIKNMRKHNEELYNNLLLHTMQAINKNIVVGSLKLLSLAGSITQLQMAMRSYTIRQRGIDSRANNISVASLPPKQQLSIAIQHGYTTLHHHNGYRVNALKEHSPNQINKVMSNSLLLRAVASRYNHHNNISYKHQPTQIATALQSIHQQQLHQVYPVWTTTNNAIHTAGLQQTIAGNQSVQQLLNHTLSQTAMSNQALHSLQLRNMAHKMYQFLPQDRMMFTKEQQNNRAAHLPDNKASSVNNNNKRQITININHALIDKQEFKVSSLKEAQQISLRQLEEQLLKILQAAAAT